MASGIVSDFAWSSLVADQVVISAPGSNSRDCGFSRAFAQPFSLAILPLPPHSPQRHLPAPAPCSQRRAEQSTTPLSSTMGIQGLKRLIADNVPGAIKEGALPNYFGRRIAIDASMFLYSFLVAIRSDSSQFLTDANGETTSHLQGVFNRTVRLLECGIKPVYVFDGKPPTLKSGELARRSDRKRIATEQLKVAQEQGDTEAIAKLVKQTVKVTPTHNEESMRLLRLMGVPVVQAPCEAEAQCAELCKAKKAWGVGTEDMDALTLGTPLLLRHLTMSEARKLPINEIKLDDVLTGLAMTNEQVLSRSHAHSPCHTLDNQIQC